MPRSILSLVAVTFTGIALTAALATGCAATKSGDATDIRYSGFLSSYDHLAASKDSDRAAFTCVKPGTDLSRYTGILIDPPVAHMSDAALVSIGEEDMTYLLTSFGHSLTESLGAKWNLVTTAGPGVLRLRTALTDADSSTGALTVFSRVLPAGVVISKVKQVAVGTGVNVGKVTAEMEIVDSETGEQIGAAVDRRIGTGVTRLVLTSWGDVKAAFDVWAERAAKRLAEHGMKPVK